MNLSIKAVSLANDEKLTRQLIDFLMGEADGMPKVQLRNQACQLAKIVIEFEFTKTLQFEFFIFNFASLSSSSVIFTKFTPSSCSFRQVYDKFKTHSTFFRVRQKRSS